MKRDLYHALRTWKASSRRKPLLLKGARQTGKTYLLKKFGSDAYDRVFYFNFEEEPAMDTFFERNLKPPRILNELSIYSKAEIHPETDLVIFDEIQVSDRALNALKYFQEEALTYPIRSTLLNLKQDGKICNVPLYATGILSSIISSNHT
jgi:hypothetical protein